MNQIKNISDLTIPQLQEWLKTQQGVLKDRKTKLAEYEKDSALGKEAYDMRKSISKLAQQISKVLIELAKREPTSKTKL